MYIERKLLSSTTYCTLMLRRESGSLFIELSTMEKRAKPNARFILLEVC